MGIYELSIKRPFTNFKRLGAGLLWNILPILNFVAIGYALRCAKFSMKNKFDMPPWDKKGELFKNGFIYWITSLIYLLPFIILFIILFSLTIPKLQSNLEKREYLIELFRIMFFNNFGLLLIIFLLFLLIVYILPSAIMNFVSKDYFNAVFEFSTIFKKAFTGKYFVTSLIMLIYSSALYLLFNFIPYVGNIISTFLIYVTSYSAYGAIYKKIRIS